MIHGDASWGHFMKMWTQRARKLTKNFILETIKTESSLRETVSLRNKDTMESSSPCQHWKGFNIWEMTCIDFFKKSVISCLLRMIIHVLAFGIYRETFNLDTEVYERG